MALVLAIEPDPKQASILKRVVRERARAEISVVDSKDAAISALSANTPDLILVTALMSPRDEEELVAHLRTLGNDAGHLQTITIPLLASAGAGDEDEEGFFKKKFRRKKSAANAVGCDPWTFAEQVAGYVRAATEARAARQAKLDYARRRAADPTPAAATPEPQMAAAESIFLEPEPAAETSDLVFTQITPPEGAPTPAHAETPPIAPEPIVTAPEPMLIIPEPEPIAATPEALFVEPEPVLMPEPVFVEPEPIDIPERRGVPALDPAFFNPEPVLMREPEPAVLPAPEPVATEPTFVEPEPVVLPEPEYAPEPLSILREPQPEPEPVAAEPTFVEPEPLAPPEPILTIEPAPFEPPAPEPVVLEPVAFEPTVIEPIAPVPEPVAAAPEPLPEIAPEPIYQTPPARVFESLVEEPPKKKSRWRDVLSRTDFGRKQKAEPPPPPPAPVYKPLKRLPPLAMWARTDDLLPREPEPVIAVKNEDDVSDLFASLAVPPNVLAVSYPRKPYVRRVRAA